MAKRNTKTAFDTANYIEIPSESSALPTAAPSDAWEALQGNKVENTDLYVMVQDKWMEQIYNSFHKIFDEEQWTKYGKMGAARAKKARDKRAAKNAKQ